MKDHVCSACHARCETCKDEAADNTFCETCNSNATIVGDTCECDPSYYFDGSFVC